MTFALVSLVAFADDPAAPEAEPAPPTSNAPSAADLRGTWWFTTKVDGKEVVAWACKGTPHSVTFDDGTLVLSVGGDPLGAAIRSTTPKGDAMALTTTIETCSGAPMTVKWADATKKVLSITRCEGGRATVRAVRDVASAVPVVRQCCDEAGKATAWVGTEEPCRAGQGQKGTPLRH